MTDQEATLVRPQPFDQWQRDLAAEAEAVRVRGIGERPRGDEPAADAGPAGEPTAAADAGAGPAADADVVPEPEAPKPKPKRGGSRRRTQRSD